MKGPSKLDQARAMREARYAVTPVLAESGDTVSDTVTPWLAPEGECASCDKRRAALQTTMRKRRVRQNEQ